FQSVDELTNAGIKVAEINKLKEAHIATVGGLLHAPRKLLLGIRGFSEATVGKLLTAAAKVDNSGSSGMFRTGTEVRQARQRVVKVHTGSAQMDALLGGGIETGSITEFFGEFRSGKTQLMHTLCVTSQLSRDMGGAEGRVVYMDTEGNFRPERIEAIAERFGLDPSETLENVIVTRVFNHEQQIERAKASDKISNKFPRKPLCLTDGPIRVIIVDSVISLFRTDFSGRGDLSERQQKLGRHLSSLLQMADDLNVAVVLVNQCMSDPGAMAMFATVKPVGGHVLAHASTTRVHLKKARDNERIAKLFDSPSMPEAECTFKITSGGIADSD
ncbi:unnamed protein product, partial [Discosporangium mesarthrocarpum]